MVSASNPYLFLLEPQTNTKGDNDLLLPVSEMVSQLKLPRKPGNGMCDNQKMQRQPENCMSTRKYH